jgi:hypothetical protein
MTGSGGAVATRVMLRSEVQQGLIGAEAGGQLGADRQSGLGDANRKTDSRNAGNVHPVSEDRVVARTSRSVVAAPPPSATPTFDRGLTDAKASLGCFHLEVF